MRRRVFSYAVLALAATATAGGIALNHLLDRPGATAMDMVPSNALAVVALDLVPAPDQIMAFKSIDDMIAGSKEPMAKTAKGALIGSLFTEFVKDPGLEPIAQQVDRSIAVAMLPKREKGGENEGEGVALMPVKDSAAVASFLRSKGKAETVEGVSLFSFKMKEGGEVLHFSLQGSVLVGSNTAWAVADVAKVAAGQSSSIVRDAGFATARGKALPSANLLVFVNPKLAKGQDWLVGSMTIRDTGIEMGVSGQTDDAQVMKAGTMAPLGPEFLANLPRGAYGFFGVAQPGPTVALSGEILDEPAKEMKEEMELDLKSDVLPALGGNLAVGFYPSFGPDAGIDLLVSIDDANGADPASLAAKLEKILDDKMEEGGKAHEWKTDSRTASGTVTHHLSDEPEKAIREGLTGAEKSFFRPLTLSRGKTIAWATVGHSVLLATSQSLLERAVQQRSTPVAALGLATDSAMGARPTQAADGQFALAISMKRLVEGIRNTVDPSHMSAENAKIYRKTLALYDNTTEPLAIRARMGGDGRYTGYVSIPFDWTKLPGMLK
jgi:hypothetical protein